MPLHLNPPSAFRAPKKATHEPVLLPPSSFKTQRPASPTGQDLNQTPAQKASKKDAVQQIPSSPPKSRPEKAAVTDGDEDPWKALALASRKLDELKQQNAELNRNRQKNLVSPDEKIKARFGMHPPPHLSHHPVPDHTQYLHLRHTADILSRQATEVAQLKTELDRTRTRCAQEVAELREKLRQVENEKMQQVSELTTKLRSVQDAHNKQMDDTTNKHKTECTMLQLRVTDLEHTVQTNETMYKSTLSSLQSNLEREKAEHTHSVSTMKEELRSKQEKVISLGSLVAQLRTYIGDSRQEVQKNSQWQCQKLLLEKRVTELEKECNSLQSTVQLINIRLSSSNEILTIQEAELAKGKIEGVDGTKLASGLLTRWREKVFALMVQLKSQDIATQMDAKDQQNMIVEWENKAASAQNKCLMLDHTIADKDAQLQMERGKVQNLTDELESLQRVADTLDAKLQEEEDAVVGLNPVLKCFRDWENSHQERMRSITTKLGSFEQRVSFATSRIDVLKGLFARKEALLKIQMSQGEQGTTCRNTCVDASTSPDTAEESMHGVDTRMSNDELERLKKERSSLAERLKDDAKYFEETLQATKEKLESKIAEVEYNSRDLEKTIGEMTQQLESQGSDLEEKEGSLTEATDTISKLKVEIAKLQVGADKASKERCDMVESQYKSQIMEMEQRLNEARREHAKAVVSLRQLERQHAREKERSVEMLKLQDEQSKLDVGRLTNQLRDVERDKNLLMATLRQEGLINQYKAQRAVAKKIPPDKESKPNDPDVSVYHQGTQSGELKTGRRVQQKKDSLNNMLADIRNLTEQVLLDKDEDSKEKEQDT